MTGRPAAGVKPVRVYLPDRELEVTVSRRRGFRAGCRCGWTSREHRGYAGARAELRAHRAHCQR